MTNSIMLYNFTFNNFPTKENKTIIHLLILFNKLLSIIVLEQHPVGCCVKTALVL